MLDGLFNFVYECFDMMNTLLEDTQIGGTPVLHFIVVYGVVSAFLKYFLHKE